MTADQNREIVQKIYFLFVTQNLPGILELQSDDVVWRFPGAPAVPYAGEYHGKDGMTRFFQNITEAATFEDFEVTAIAAEEDRVIVTGSERLRSNVTGKKAVNDWAMYWTLRDGLVVSMTSFEDTAALAEAFSA
jgi:ketosteroid isomerase-like protein